MEDGSWGTTVSIISAILIVFLFILKPAMFEYIDDVVAATNLNKAALPDLGHVLLPDLRDYHYIGNFIAVGFIGAALTATSNTEVWKEICIVYVSLLLLKLVFDAATILPDPSGMCKKKNDLFGRCNDLMPSGHIGLAYVVIFALWKHVDNRWRAGLLAALAILYFVTIASRNHYTIDTLMSGFVVFTLHSVYHQTR